MRQIVGQAANDVRGGCFVYPAVYPSTFLLIGHFQQSLVPQSPPFVRSAPESRHVRWLTPQAREGEYESGAECVSGYYL
jgi:hypothetical protein